MKTKLNLLLFAALSALVFSSCKRTDYANEVDPQLMGTWKLVSTSVRTTAEVTLDNLRTVTITDYVTENNKGTITFEPTKVTAKNISYDINSTISVRTYEDGILDDTFESPWNLSMPSSTTVTDYTRISKDTLLLKGAVMATPNGASVEIPNQGNKIRYTINGNRLNYVGKVDYYQAANYQGIYSVVKVIGIMEVTLER